MHLLESLGPRYDALEIVQKVVDTFPAFQDEVIHPEVGKGESLFAISKELQTSVLTEEGQFYSVPMEEASNPCCRAMGCLLFVYRR